MGLLSLLVLENEYGRPEALYRQHQTWRDAIDADVGARHHGQALDQMDLSCFRHRVRLEPSGMSVSICD